MTNAYVVVFSGGLDSTVLLHDLASRGEAKRALTVNYGQRHAVEVRRAQQIASACGVPHDVADLSALSAMLPGSSQTDTAVPVPHGHYAADSMKLTVVPNRNMILLAVALGTAAAHGCTGVAYAAHSGDHFIYPDCRPDFIEAMQAAALLCHAPGLKLLAPFASMDKTDIVYLGSRLGVPFELTWTCYEGDLGDGRHCGQCGACVERREAFRLARICDPTHYRV